MFIDRFRLFTAIHVCVRIRKLLKSKCYITRFLDILRHRCHKPQRIVGTRILDPVYDAVFVRLRNNRGRFERFRTRILHKPFRLEKMQTVSFAGQSPQQLLDTLLTFLRIGMRNRHCILRRIPVAKSHSSADLNERSEP